MIMKRNFLIGIMVLISFIAFSQAIIIDHNCTKLASMPESAITTAKQDLHIAYEHTSHGSQLMTGMTALDGQTSLNGYKGDIYKWHDGVVSGSLDIDDTFADGSDLGHNGDTAWAQKTRIYLNNPAHSDVNVIIWSWCGGVQDNTPEGIQIYLDKMNDLEQAYPNVKFVYMTGHSNIWNDATVKASNKQIRDYCIANDKILYDFYDIERYNPDGTFFEFTNDNCDYYNSAGGSPAGNWATEWRASHTQGTDWYNCTAAHSDALNGNLSVSTVSSSQIDLTWDASTDNVAVSGYQIFRNGTSIATSNTNSYSSTGLTASTEYAYTVLAYDAEGNKSAQSDAASATTNDGTDTEAPTVPKNLNASVVSSSQIDLTWDASTDNVAVTGYEIFRGGTSIGTSNTNSYSNTGLTASTEYTYTVLASDAEGNKSAQSDAANASTTTTGISSISGEGINIYPNPTSGKIYFKFEKSNIKKITISNMSGGILLEKSNIKNNGTTDISNFRNGIYFINILSKQGNYTKKIIKK